jgi:tol-pal system protein YbgF
MVGATYSPKTGCSLKMSLAMIRSASLLVVAFVCTLWAHSACAQSSADLLTRIDHLEAAMRDLTGSMEQLQYRNQQLEQQVQQLQAAMQGGGGRPAAAPQRPQAQYAPPSQTYPAAQNSPPQYSSPQYSSPQYAPPAQYSQPASAPYVQPSIAATEPTEVPASSPGRRSDAFNPALDPSAPGAPRSLGAPGVAAAEPPPVYNPQPSGGSIGGRQPGAPLDLSNGSVPPDGALPPPPPRNTNATGTMQATLPPTNSPRDEYELGYGYVQHKDYALAVDTFGDFLHKYPSDRQAPEAQYWLGESLFQSQRYRDAAEAFLAVSTKYDTMAKAPDALLRLGQSLAALGEKEAACASLGEVLRKYPRASLSVRQGVDREQKRAHC